jgi:Fe(3+) dicitrate transport protein
VPGSGTTVTREELEREAPADVAEALRRVPGVTARQEYGGGSRLDISVRGLDAGRSRRVLMLEDGIPISLNPYAEPDMYYAPPIERMRGIEVVKGSGNILFGPQTLGGVINFLTLEPPDRTRAVADVEAGRFGYVRSVASYGDAALDGGVRWVVQVVDRRGDGFRSQPFVGDDVLGKLVFDTSSKGRATLKLGYHRDSAASEDVGLTSAMFANTPRRPTLAPHDQLVLNRYDVSLTHEQRFSKQTKLKTLLYAYSTDRIWGRQDYTRSPSAGDAYERIIGDVTTPNNAIYFSNTSTVLDRTYEVAGVEPRLEHRFSTGDVGHTMDVGARVLVEEAHYQQRTGDYPDSLSGVLDNEEKHRSVGIAGYLQDRASFLDDRVQITPGVRFEHATFHRVVLRQSDGTATRDTSAAGDTDTNGVIPGVGIVYGSRDNHLFGGMHMGFAPPRVASSISPKGVPANVSAEQSINYELGARTAPSKWIRGEAAAYMSNYTNQVVANGSPGADTTALSDAGATRHYGFESSTVVGIGKALHLPLTIDVGARYTYSRAYFLVGENAGNLLPYAPRHLMSANVDVEHEIGLGGQIAYSYTAAQFTDSANTVAEDATGRIGQIPGYHLIDATAHYRIKKSSLSFRLTVKNALDSTYVYARRPEGIFVGGFRQILLAARWEYDAPPPK